MYSQLEIGLSSDDLSDCCLAFGLFKIFSEYGNWPRLEESNGISYHELELVVLISPT